MDANIGSSSPTTKVEFKQPFKNTPLVFVQAASTAINLRFTAKDVTAKGFNIYGYYNNSGSEKVRWFAIGN